MRKLFFFEKKTEFADAARRLYHYLTERERMKEVRSVRVLRCIIFSDRGEQSLTPKEEALLWDRQTELPVSESVLRAEAQRKDCTVISTVPLFQRPAERLTEQAVRFSFGTESLTLRQADVFLIYGEKSEENEKKLRARLINPVSSAELRLWDAGMLPPVPAYREYSAAVIRGFRKGTDDGLFAFSEKAGFRMSNDDIRFVQSYYTVEEKRDPNLFELRFLDMVWSDHCRHSTFMTAIEDLRINDRAVCESFDEYLRVREELYGTRTKTISLQDIAEVPARYFRRIGRLTNAVETGENDNNTVLFDVTVKHGAHEDAIREPWLLHFKNEAHNGSTEREPFLGAENSFGAAMCDVLAARGTAFAAIRLSGIGEIPTSSANGIPKEKGKLSDDGTFGETKPGSAAEKEAQEETKENQEKETRLFRKANAATDGFSAFGSQCGVPVGLVREWIHPGYGVRRMEVCMTASAIPASSWKAAKPVPGDVILLLGAFTGREGLGGALNIPAEDSGHNTHDPLFAAQAGDPAIARALARFLRRADAAAMIKRAGAVGAGGLAAAASELADGIRIDLDKVPTVGMKREGRSADPYAIAVSETQERMLLVSSPIHGYTLQRIAAEENLPVSVIGVVTEERRFRILWKEETLLNLSRDFLDSMGAEKRISAEIPQMQTDDLFSAETNTPVRAGEEFASLFCRVLSSQEVCAQNGLSSHYDICSGGRTVLLPFGGKYRLTPNDYMAVRFPVEPGAETHTCAVFTYGFSPAVSEISPYHGAYLSVLQAICRIAASGRDYSRCVLSLQEFFPVVSSDPVRFGVLLSAMLGAFQAQMDYGVAAVGGEESISGTTEEGDVPPTLIAFAVSAGEQETLLTSEFKKAGSRVYLMEPARRENRFPEPEDEKGLLRYLHHIAKEGKVLSCMALGAGGIAAGVAQMCFGNHIGFNFEVRKNDELQKSGMALFDARYGAFLVETDSELRGTLLGYTKDTANLLFSGRTVSLKVLADAWQEPQKKMYSGSTGIEDRNIVAGFPYREQNIFMPSVLISKPSVLLPVFPGTSGEEALAARFLSAGITPNRFVFRTGNRERMTESIRAFAAALRETQILAFPGGGYPGYGSYPGAIPDPTACYVRAVFENPLMEEAVGAFRTQAKGLVLGLGEGFRMLLYAGFFDLRMPGGARERALFSLTANRTGRLHSGMVRVKVMSEKSPWMRFCKVGETAILPVASCAGRCLIPGEAVLTLAENGQIASQYVDEDGNPSMDTCWNPFSSDFAVEGIFSEDGRVFGRMAHNDFADSTLAVNVPGGMEQDIFRAAADYYAIK